ncbi:PAN domain-containing protein [Aureimonas ureilytica]|uniref:PAN domain-containing protein n=1 Tax=Aureimonas ureilytica TaxID=401562 RepID=UPI0009ECBAA1|nr:PAN domain-containing protein [Aureimonas ureilytica]
MLSRFLSLAVGLLSLLSVDLAAAAEPSALAPFRLDPARLDIIELNGELTSGSALAFRRALLAAPNAKILLLNSPGGSVDAGLLIADDVHTRKLATLIPEGSTCASACSYIFLAGHERQADGRLGVHQMWSQKPDLESAQMSIADVIDTLNRFETPIGVVTIMFRTPPDDMHFFSPEEVVRLGINNKGGSVEQVGPQVAGSERASPQPSPSITSADAEPKEAAKLSEGIAAAAPALSDRSSAALSTLETYTRQPTRMAIYAGLDFFGEDVGTASVADAPACAVKCFEMGGSCKAFTFNMKTRPGRGPNCFMKSGRGEVDGNSAAFSGQLLARSERDPPSMTLDVIDPNSDLYQDVDIPGMDLSRRPHPATSQLDCRRACVTDARCVAFTYLKPKKQCWLKSGVGTPRALTGAVTGGKKSQTFSPKVISLD